VHHIRVLIVKKLTKNLTKSLICEFTLYVSQTFQHKFRTCIIIIRLNKIHFNKNHELIFSLERKIDIYIFSYILRDVHYNNKNNDIYGDQKPLYNGYSKMCSGDLFQHSCLKYLSVKQCQNYMNAHYK
jgi:hypothetical protein